jgi:hypothetical protein
MVGAALAACHREADAGAPGDPSEPGSIGECASSAGRPCAADAAPLPPPPDLAGWKEDWARATAASADDDDLARIAQREGAAGLEAKLGATDVNLRRAAIAALAFVAEEERFDALPDLARLASAGDADDASRALATIEALAARPHRAVDREDAVPLHDGCALLVPLSRLPEDPRARSAARSLSMLADFGCKAR